MIKVITVIVPVFCEEGNIHRFYETIMPILNRLPDCQTTVLFVDDGSTDNTREVINEIIKKDKRINLITFARNFGKEAALTAGVLESLDSDAVICIDADLQHPPEIIPKLVEFWNAGYPVVATVRNSVKSHSLFRRSCSFLYYSLTSKVGGNHLIPRSTDFRLLDKRVITEFSKFDETVQMFRASIDWLGFDTAKVNFDAPERFSGHANYSFPKLFDLAIASFTSFSLWPLKFTGYLGLLISFFSFVVLLFCLCLNIFSSEWYATPLALFVIFNTFLAGVLMSCIGLLALYIGNINTQVANRPKYVISSRNP